MPEAGGFERPEMEVLRDANLIPPENLVRPRPNRFTHRVIQSTPFFYGARTPGAAPDGEFPAGTRVVLLVDDGGTQCRVVDGQGLYVEVPCAALIRLRTRRPRPV